MITVYVGLSGGVDSSVSAALLKQQGYNVVGVYMKNWTEDVVGIACPWKEDLADARAAAAVIDIPFKVFDFQDQYRARVVDVMVAEYAAGRTPNPDVLCNQEIKFKLFLELALADGADLIATGHYAHVQDGTLFRAVDTAKDQTYFLYRVTAAALAKTIFPLAHLTKPQVRDLAVQFNLPTATKPDSQGICFVGEVGIRPFLSQYIDSRPGPIIDQTGQTVGTHQGAALYTVGQRQGLGVGGPGPYYVTGRNVMTNTVTITDDPTGLELSGDHFALSEPHWIMAAPQSGQTYHVRLRHRGVLVPATLVQTINAWTVRLHTPQRAIASGQSAVIYDGNTVLGGGFIAE